jgi:hypothetical protein
MAESPDEYTLKNEPTTFQVHNPIHSDHQFRSMPIADSDASRSVIPEHVDRGFRSMPITRIIEKT